MRPWFAVLALCVCLPVHAQQPPSAESPAQQPPSAESPAPRAEPVYRVEVIVFRALSALGAPENWSVERGGVTASPQASRAIVRRLSASEFELNGVAQRLRTSGRFLPVAHAAWWQTASPWGRPIEIPLRSIGLEAQGLTGTVSLQRGEFLHLELSLDYDEENPPEGLAAAPGTVFSLHEIHRVKFNERNYFDHPAFGVVALVTSAQPSKRAQH